MSYIEILVSGDPAAARTAAEDAIQGRDFRFTWMSDWAAVAERGSKVANYFLGGVSPYQRIGMRILTAQPGETVVRIESQSRGMNPRSWWFQNQEMTQELHAIRDLLEATFSRTGTLRGLREG